MEKKADSLEFAFLPYALLRDDIKIGDVLLWPFYAKKDKYIEDQPIRSWMEQYFKQYIDPRKEKRPLKNPTIVSYKSPNNFEPFPKKQELENTVTMLSFSAITKKPDTFSSDNFQLYYQRFKQGDNRIALYSGSYIHYNDGLYKIEDLIFTTTYLSEETGRST